MGAQAALSTVKNFLPGGLAHRRRFPEQYDAEGKPRQRPTLRHRAHWHLCCWAWRLALVIPLLHLVLHLLGVPHPEGIGFLP